jgi:hypothetical protein
MAQSGADGAYTLRNIQPGTFTLEAVNDHMFFEPIRNQKLSIWLNELPALELQSLDLCGKVNFNLKAEDSNRFQYSEVTVHLRSKNEQRSTILSENGEYCFSTKPGVYDVYTSTKNQGLTLQPKQHPVKLVRSPVLDISFFR